MHNVPRGKPMRGERYVCWHIDCRYEYTSTRCCGGSRGVPPQGFGKDGKAQQVMLSLMLQ